MEPKLFLKDCQYVSVCFHKDRIYACDPVAKCVRVISATDGAELMQIGKDVLRLPHGVVVDQDGVVWVSSQESNSIMCFNSEDGSKVNELPISEEDECLLAPCGLAQSDKFIYVANRDKHNVLAFSKSDLSYRSFGSKGAGNGQFKRFEGVDVDASGNIVVADFGNSRIQVLSPSGRFLRLFGEEGFANGQMKKPRDVAVSPGVGNIVVADFGNHRLSLWSPQGEFISVLGSRGDEPGEFRFPCAVSFSENGDFVVCDNGKLQVFDGSIVNVMM